MKRNGIYSPVIPTISTIPTLVEIVGFVGMSNEFHPGRQDFTVKACASLHKALTLSMIIRECK